MNIRYSITSGKEGLGITTLETIYKGTCVWTSKLNENVFEYNEADTLKHLKSFRNLHEAKAFLDVTYGRGDKLCLILDDGRYMNHAASPNNNCRTDLTTGHCYAIRTILPGEQLYEDYAAFDHPPFLFALLKKYDCEPTYYDLPEKHS